jgi:transposase-like protein
VFHDRTGTPFHRLHYPTDIVSLVVLWRYRSQLSLQDLAEMLLLRGISFTPEAVRDWEGKLAPWLSGTRRRKRRAAVSARWDVDETYGYSAENNECSTALCHARLQ